MPNAARRPRALVVDDDAFVLDFLCAAFARIGWDVVPVSDGSRAFEAARAHAPDLVLLDLMMPGLDGYSVLARMRQDPALADAPIVLVSAEPACVHDSIGRDLGATAYLEKPLSVDGLRRLVDSLGVGSRA